MKIYQNEISAGLQDQIKQNTCSIACSVYNHVPSEQEVLKTFAMANPNQKDLFYLEAVLASIGWNDNDDVFDPKETFRALSSPVDKQFNFMHNENDIIGHITSSKLIADGKVLENLTEDTLPEKFDIIVGSVLYKRWEDPKLQSRMDQIIAEISEDKWFVSMECLFPHFDYAIVTPEGQAKSIARNEQTSFLTQHLRAYGGKGEYEGHKVGRLLRHFTFSGKGLVDNPANKRSVIFNFSNVSDQETSFQVVANKELDMPFTEEQYKDLQNRLASAEAKAKDVADKAVSSQLSEMQSQIDTLKTEKTEAEAKVVDLESQLAIVTETSEAKTDTAETLAAKVADLEASLAEKTASLDAIEADKIKASRLEAFNGKEIDSAKAVNLVEKCANMAQEAFEALVDSFPAKAEFDKDKMKKDKEKDKDKDAKDKDAKAKSDEEILEQLDLGLADVLVVPDTNESDEVRASAAKWFGSTLLVKGD